MGCKLRHKMTDTTCDLTDEQILNALGVDATASGSAALLSGWNERRITAEDVLRRVAASPRLPGVARPSAPLCRRAALGEARQAQ
jgi:hypothetical protein